MRERLLEARDDGRQRVARLRVGGDDPQRAFVGGGEPPADLRQVLRIDQHALDDLDGLLAGLRQTEQPLAATHEQLDAELVLEILDVLADARLRGQQRVGDLGQIEIATGGLADDAELLKIHAQLASGCRRDNCPRGG